MNESKLTLLTFLTSFGRGVRESRSCQKHVLKEPIASHHAYYLLLEWLARLSVKMCSVCCLVNTKLAEDPELDHCIHSTQDSSNWSRREKRTSLRD